MLVEKTSEHVGTPYYMMTQDDANAKPNQDDVDFGDEDFVIDRGHTSDEPEAKKSRLDEDKFEAVPSE